MCLLLLYTDSSYNHSVTSTKCPNFSCILSKSWSTFLIEQWDILIHDVYFSIHDLFTISSIADTDTVSLVVNFITKNNIQVTL